MIYRKRILLAITEVFGGSLNGTEFQKLLFLLCEEQFESAKFDFVPYKFGGFSFQAVADKANLIKEGHLKDSKSWVLAKPGLHFFDTLDDSDRKELLTLKKKFKGFTARRLLRYMYLNYPYFAIKSEVAHKHLSKEELAVVEKFQPRQKDPKLLTLGYEGLTLEKYLNSLIHQNIQVLCDVRRNPISRKFGFSKKTLDKVCESLNIRYVHLPELGIASEKRKNLNSKADYRKLFVEYEEEVIPQQMETLSIILDLLSNGKRVALTCFEAAPHMCHRTRVANAIMTIKPGIPLEHL